MAGGKKKRSGTLDRAAEVVGHALGSVVGTIESIQEQHPHPVEEAREALAAGQETVSAVASNASTRAAKVIKKAKAMGRRTKKAAARVRPKSRAAVARMKRTARKVVSRAKKAVGRGRKRSGRKKR